MLLSVVRLTWVISATLHIIAIENYCLYVRIVRITGCHSGIFLQKPILKCNPQTLLQLISTIFCCSPILRLQQAQ